MSRLKRISLLVLLCLVFLIGSVYAAEGKVELVKNFEKLEPGKTGTVELKLSSSDKTIVGMKMAVKSSENIDITEVKSASEQWNLVAYNSGNGLAVLTNTNGTESGSIVKISFKVKDDTKAEEGSISVENFEVSSKEYDYVTISNVSTKITIGQATNKPTNNVNNTQNSTNTSKNNVVNTQNSTNTSKNNVVNIQSSTNTSKNNVVNIQSSTNTSNKVDNTIINGEIPRTGKSTIIVCVITVVAIIGIACYIKYKRLD